MDSNLDDERIAALESPFSDGGQSALQMPGFLERFPGQIDTLLDVRAPGWPVLAERVSVWAHGLVLAVSVVLRLVSDLTSLSKIWLLEWTG